jgi:H+/gluconate symporter-like permease
MYELMGRAHAWLAQERGQGTVEYVGLILLLAGVMAAVVLASQGFKSDITTTIVAKLKSAIDQVGSAK